MEVGAGSSQRLGDRGPAFLRVAVQRHGFQALEKDMPGYRTCIYISEEQGKDSQL